MAVIHPFKAWRPSDDEVQDIACVPYDVVNTEEAKDLAEGKPNSFLHVIRPEIDLDDIDSLYDEEVYEKGAENLRKLIDNDILEQDDEPAVYIYRLIMDGRSQIGIFTCVSVDDYDNEVILKHELTRPKKEDDRTRHIRTQSAHAEPVMMTFKDTQGVSKEAAHVANLTQPLYDFTASDGVKHTIWKTTDVEPFVEAFEKIDNLYIADGHHRCKSASRVAAQKKEENTDHTGDEEYNFFPAVLFPMEQMEILAYNRIIYEVPSNFIKSLKEHYSITEDADPVPDEKGAISIYYEGEWYEMKLPMPDEADSAEKLDVSRLQTYILEPLLSISDQRRDENIHFVGGIRGTEELERLVDSGTADLAISMYPTDIRELIDVSDEGLLMPPKSTWFEPKLRSGLLVHTF